MEKKHTRRSPKHRRRKQRKKRRIYRVRNWREYNSGLVDRGNVTLWLDDALLANWGTPQKTGHRGGSKVYSDAIVVTALTLGSLFNLPLRGTKGFLASLLKMKDMGHLRVPDPSTLCRRRKQLPVSLPCRRHEEPLHLIVDATGCKVYGEGEWKVRQHGWSKHRTWRKLHIGLDAANLEIVAVELTPNSSTDGQILPELLNQVDGAIGQISGDGGYDKRNCYEAIEKRREGQETKVQVAIPPQRGARIWKHGNTKGERLARDQNLRRIRAVGRARWKEEIGYHRRSLAETTMFRFKNQFGERLSSRTIQGQETEVRIRCAILNRMIQMARPESYLVEAS